MFASTYAAVRPTHRPTGQRQLPALAAATLSGAQKQISKFGSAVRAAKVVEQRSTSTSVKPGVALEAAATCSTPDGRYPR
jgi:hypothetical protein